MKMTEIENLYYDNLLINMEKKLNLIKEHLINKEFILNLKVISFLDKNFILIPEVFDKNIDPNEYQKYIATSDYLYNEELSLRISIELDQNKFKKASFTGYAPELPIPNLSFSIPTINEVERFMHGILEEKTKNTKIKVLLNEISMMIKNFELLGEAIKKDIFNKRIKFNDRFYIQDFNKEIVDFIMIKEDINLNNILIEKNKYIKKLNINKKLN